MSLVQINRTPSRRQSLTFAVLWLPGFLVLVAALLWQRHHSLPLSGALASGAALSALVGLAVPAAARLLFVAAMYVTFPVSWVVSHALLAVIYYLVFAPVGLVGRLVGYDPMRKRLNRKASTYWLARDESNEPDRYFRQS